MGNFKIDGTNEYIEHLQALYGDCEIIIKKGVYDGAKVVADAVRAAVEALPVQEGEKKGLPPYGTYANKIYGISGEQKRDLTKGMGLAEMENKAGYINTKLGFDGYGSVPTKKYPKGIPNALLMRAIISGSKFRKKNTSVRTAIRRQKAAAISAMEKTITKEIEKEMK